MSASFDSVRVYYAMDKKYAGKRVETDNKKDAWWPQLHSFAIGLEGAPDLIKELMETIHFVRDEFDMTVLLIEHDMKLVSGICEKLTVLNFGQVLAEGKTTEVLNDPQVIKAYLGE